MNGTGYVAYPISDLVIGGTRDDGQPYVGERFYVVIENNAGRRFRHGTSFPGFRAFTCAETGEPAFQCLRDEAERKAGALSQRVNEAIERGQTLVDAYWQEIEPAYGSDEYVSQGTELSRLMEERQNA